MILSTPTELRSYLPSHVIEHIDTMAGFIDSSEHDFLMDKVGRPLYDRLCKEYETCRDNIEALLPQNATDHTPWMQLIVLCQRVVTFDAFFRSADITSVSVSDSGINTIGTDGYDPADKDSLARYKTRMSIEAHRGVDRLLMQLEEWAQWVGSVEVFSGNQNPDESGEANIEVPAKGEQTEEARRLADCTEIVALWRKSRYYYLADGLFINTATKFNEFIDIYDSREKFIQLLPDLRYCQELMLRPELGDDLTDDLVAKYQNGTLNTIQQKAVEKLQRALTLCVEARNKMFTRKEARDESLMNLRMAVTFIAKNQDSFLSAIETSPIYVKPKAPVTGSSATPSSGCAPSVAEQPNERWKNNRRGDALFVTGAIE